MKTRASSIYAKLTEKRHEAVFSGISFADFMESVTPPIENILLLKGDYLGEKNLHKFEILEGREQIAKLMLEDIYSYGDFCFIDYSDVASINNLKEEQIAELLYLSHMFKPLKSPFFDVLQNKFAYLSHDDGWYCRLYCNDWKSPVKLLHDTLIKSVKKILCSDSFSLPDGLIESVCNFSSEGVFIEIDALAKRSKIAVVRLYETGECNDIDALFNTTELHEPCMSVEIRKNNIA